MVFDWFFKRASAADMRPDDEQERAQLKRDELARQTREVAAGEALGAELRAMIRAVEERAAGGSDGSG